MASSTVSKAADIPLGCDLPLSAWAPAGFFQGGGRGEARASGQRPEGGRVLGGVVSFPIWGGVWGWGCAPAQKIFRPLLLKSCISSRLILGGCINVLPLPGILHYRPTASHGRIKKWGEDEGPKAPRIETLGMGRGFPHLYSHTRGLKERRKFPHRGRGRSPAQPRDIVNFDAFRWSLLLQF